MSNGGLEVQSGTGTGIVPDTDSMVKKFCARAGMFVSEAVDWR